MEFEDRDLKKSPFSAAELDRLVGKGDVAPFLNTRNREFRELGWKEKLPARRTVFSEMARNVNLIRRPILRAGSKLLFGFDREAWEKALGL